MIFGRQALELAVLMAMIVFLLVGLLAMPAWARYGGDTVVENGDVDRTRAGEVQYDDEAVCRAVINTITDGNQSNEIDQYANRDNINDIAQKLNISPSVVQECIEGNLDEATDDNGDDTNGNEDDNIVNVPSKALPNTGGPSLLAIGFSLVAGAGLLTALVRRR